MKTLNKNYIFAVGRRREAVARVRLYENSKELVIGETPVNKGDIYVNGKKAEAYFNSKVSQALYMEPLKSTNTIGKFAITVVIVGGGPNGQLGAFLHGLSRAIASIDQKNRDILKKKGFLTRDPRARERRKVGMGGKARRKRQSPKR